MPKYLTLILVCLIWGCKDENLEQKDLELRKAFLTQTETGIYQGGSSLMLFQDDIHQIAYTNDLKSWRIQTDEQQQFFACSLDKTPLIEEKTTVIVSAEGFKDIHSGTQTAVLLKAENNKQWLWLPESEIGIIIQHYNK